MDKLKVRASIEFVSLGVGNKANSKMMKAKPVLRYLGDERLLFVNTCPSLEELYDELSKFGTAAATHDDIVDALAILVNQFSSYAEMEARITAQKDTYCPDPMGRAKYEQIYGLGAYAKFNAQQMVQENPDMSLYEAINAVREDAHDPTTSDPLADCF
jgi:hypothetical protein